MKKEEKNIKIEEMSPRIDWLRAELAKLDEIELPDHFEEGLEEKLKACDEAKAPVFGMINEDEKVKMAKTIAYLLIPLAAAFVLIVGLSMNSLKIERGNQSLAKGEAHDDYISEEMKTEDRGDFAAAEETMPGEGFESNKMAENQDADRNSTEETKAGAASDGELQSQKLIFRTYLNIEIENYAEFNQKLRNRLKEYGGYIEHSEQQADTVMRKGKVEEIIRGSYTLRVPVEKYEDFLKDVQNNVKLENKNENVQNVTAEYRDIEQNVKNLEIKEETLRNLMKEAKNVEESLAIFEHLSETRGEIDRLQSRLKNLDKMVSYSTIELSFHEKEKEPDIEPIDEKLGDRISKRFTESINYLVTLAEDAVVVITGDSPVYLLVIFAILVAALILVVIVKKIIKKLNK